MHFFTIISLGFVFVNAVYGKYRSLQVEKTILGSIFEGYDPRIRPAGENGTGPVVVEVNTYVRNIKNIDDVNMVYDTQLTFRQSWVDDRLKYTNKDLDYVTLTNPALLWVPDIFFSNEQTGHFHNMLLPNVLIRIFPNGRILYSVRISLHLFCPMDLKNYPLDNQVCKIIAASYGYTTQDIVFVWKNQDPIQITKTLKLSRFNLLGFTTGYCTSKTNTGEYSCINLEFFFSRDFFYYLVQVYMPTTFMVLLSWLVFWVNPKYSTIRFGTMIGVLIASILITTSINSITPQVSYTKAIDIWIGVCVCFIFCGMLELVLVVNAVSNEERARLKSQLAAEESLGDKSAEGKSHQGRKFTSAPLRWLNRYSSGAQRIDVFSRFFFPAAFAFFNFIYWLKYAAAR